MVLVTSESDSTACALGTRFMRWGGSGDLGCKGSGENGHGGCPGGGDAGRKSGGGFFLKKKY